MLSLKYAYEKVKETQVPSVLVLTRRSTTYEQTVKPKCLQ
jgi:hypothetical protein